MGSCDWEYKDCKAVVNHLKNIDESLIEIKKLLNDFLYNYHQYEGKK